MLVLELENAGWFPEETATLTFFFSPTAMVISLSENFTVGFLTVILQLFATPSTVAVMNATPFFMAVTSPLLSTVATLFLLLFHFGMLLDVDLTVRRNLPFRYMEIEFLLNVTVGFFTVTIQDAAVLSTVAVIIAVPGFFAVIVPFSLTVAMLFLFERNVAGCPVDETVGLGVGEMVIS